MSKGSKFEMGHTNTQGHQVAGLQVYFVLLDEKYCKVGFHFFSVWVFFFYNVFGDSKD